MNPTTYKTYVRDALRTESDHMDAFGRICKDPRKLRLLHGAMGLQTEAGEFTDALKKHLFYGKPLDMVNLKEELGDIFWYLAILCDTLGEANFTNILQRNIAKLRERYPEKFTEDKAQNRDLEAERKILENKHQFQEGVGGSGICRVCGWPKENDFHSAT